MTWLLIISAIVFSPSDANVKRTVISSTPYANKAQCDAAAARFNNVTRHPADQVATCDSGKVVS